MVWHLLFAVLCPVKIVRRAPAGVGGRAQLRLISPGVGVQLVREGAGGGAS